MARGSFYKDSLLFGYIWQIAFCNGSHQQRDDQIDLLQGSQFTSHLIRNLDLKNVCVETVGSSEDEPITVSQPRLGLPR